MLNFLIDSVSTPRRDIDPAALAEKLSLTSAELASLIGVSRNTIATGKASAKLQAALQPLVKILALASDAAGSEHRAMLWFKYNPIVSLGTKTALEHVHDGHADWVLGHLENVLNGVYA